MEWITKFFSKSEVMDERVARDGFVEFADLLANNPPFPYNKLYSMVVKYMNIVDYDKEYLSSITIGLLVFLKTIQTEEQRQEKILRYLNTFFDVEYLDKNKQYSLYDTPEQIKHVYEY